MLKRSLGQEELRKRWLHCRVGCALQMLRKPREVFVKSSLVILVGAIGCVVSTVNAVKADSSPVVVTVESSVTSAPISKHAYGQFLEHIGPIVNHGLWAEMIDDRKFYSPIVEAEPPPPSDPRAAWRGRTRSWIRIGPTEAVTLEAKDAYVGEHSPLLRLNEADPVGFQQAGLALLKGKQYEGHIVLSGGPEATVDVILAWGDGEKARQVVTIQNLSTDYTRHPLEFTASVTTNDARIEIVARGHGVARVGVLSLMPADNIEGFRAEVVEQLKQIDAGVYRFPGGNFVSAHEWRSAIGPRDKRPPIFDPVWKAVQPNDVGTDEFLALCRLLGADPYITTSAGFGDAWSAAQLVEYVNGDVSTAMGKLRADNGHREPYGVKLWGIGNEPWGDWQFGHMPIGQYVHKHNDFAKSMRKVDPSIVLIGAGAMPKTMTTAKQSLRYGASLIPEPLSAADWTGGLLMHSLDYMDQISEHFYAYANTRFDLEKGEQVPVDVDEPLVDLMRRPANHVRATYEEYQDYLERIPALREKRIPLNIDEWAMIGLPPNSYKVVPAYAWAFHEMFRHSDVIQGAAFTFGTSLVSATRSQAQLNPAGVLFKLYSRHYGKIPVRVIGDRPQPAPAYPAGGEQPKVNAGSDTFPLDVTAAWNEDRRQLTIAVINPTESDQRMQLQIKDANVAGGTLRRLAHPDINFVAAPGQPPAVKIVEQSLARLPRAITVPRYSVSLYSLDVTH
jgi:alpha-N-arabinofuranosidase